MHKIAKKGKTNFKKSYIPNKEWSFLKLVKILNIKGALLDRYQLEHYLEKIASDHVLQDKSTKDTYPIPRLEDNFKVITKTYEILNQHLKQGINIHPAGEWLLDNYYIIEEAVKTIQKELTLKKYTNFIGMATGAYKGFARIYVLATEIVAYTDSKVDSKNLENLLRAYQTKKTLNMEEIWNIGTFLQIAIIENIRSICEKIFSSQMQKYKVEHILERLVEYKSKNEQKFKMEANYKTKIKEEGNMKYPFIEYMSYRLKRYGKRAYNYLNVLEEQVNKMGTSVSDVIRKEHFDIAVKKVSIGNCIKSIKEIQRINFLEIFESINGVEILLKQDPAGVYENMDYKTKEYYRGKIKEIAKRTKISELYITKKVLELAQQKDKTANDIHEKKKSHIGYYLIREGIQELYHTLQTNKKVRTTKGISKKVYLATIAILSCVIPFLLAKQVYTSSNIIIAILLFILSYVPATQITTEILQYILNKIVKPKLIPKMNYEYGIPENQKTMVILPTIVKDATKVKDLMKKLEVFYHANQSENLYFALLADVTTSTQKEEKQDKEIVQAGLEEANRLNEKYPSNGFGKFQFVYRKRVWSKSENAYLGWERKRGLIEQFNHYLLGKIKNPFLANSMEQETHKKPNIRYIITLDADTNLVLNSGLELIGAMAHILNQPELDKTGHAVIAGHALIQPRIGIDLVSSRKSKFAQIFALAGGTDSYTNAISDTYQDNFEEGIFTGKGIYDLEVFTTILKEQIPENTVLSHDLLEGNYTRCGLASDILLLDGFPYQYNAFCSRLHRWIRGDWQIARWIKKTPKNPLNLLARFKILDNLRRSLVEVFVLVCAIFILWIQFNFNMKIWPTILFLLTTILLPSILELLSYMMAKQAGNVKQKYFIDSITGLKAIFLRAFTAFACLPHKAYLSANAIIKTIYRMKISKKNLLEWTTAEEAEKKAKTTLLSYYKLMTSNVIISLLLVLYAIFLNEGGSRIALLVVSAIWILAPIFAWQISKERIQPAKVKELKEDEVKYIVEIGQKTWEFFDTYMNKENHYLPPDNYQEDRANKIVYRTSSTNIGLGLISIVSAYDLGYIDFKKAIDLINKTMETIAKLAKWNGHLYNWYNTKTLEPLIPRYISTVDSGNFVGYLYVLKEFLKNIPEPTNQIQNLIMQINDLIDNTDFSVLYDKEKRLFSIGYNLEDNKLTDSYYDLLASEARQASLVAIAKHDVPTKHWQNLSRTLTIMNGYKGLVSWSGTAFEYLMPNVNIKKYEGSLLDESSKFLIMSQQEYANRLGIPWGISESAFNLKDLNSNYQYKAFGIPWLGLKRGLGDEMVVSSYGTILALFDEPKAVWQNLKSLEQKGMYGKYGFYESIDFTPKRIPVSSKYAVVKTYMAHHQGLILLSINNLINNNILQERFMGNPQIKAVDILLQERMPEDVVITKEKKEKIEKLKNIDYENYTMKTYTKIQPELNNYNVISNENYTICMNEKGEGYSKYKDIMVNRFKASNDYPEGIFFFVKNIRSKRIWSTGYQNSIKPDKYEISFTPDRNQITRVDENITTTCKTIVAPDEAVEIRLIELKNDGNIEETLEITSLFEPVLSTKEQDYAHMAFNNLFLKYEYLEDTNSILVKRNKRGNSKEIYLGVNLYTQDETVGEMEYEIDAEKLNAGSSFLIPKMIENSVPFSKQLGLSVAPIVALKRTMKIPPKQKITLNLIISVAEEKEQVEENLKKYRNYENIIRAFELSRVRVEEESRYLGIKGSNIETYQKILSYLIVQNPMQSLYNKVDKAYTQQDLWKYGISGDFPILLVKIKDVNDIDMIKEILKAYEFFRVKNITVELVILDEEENVYEKYVREAIEGEIANRHLEYVRNLRGGIFVLNANEIEDKELLEFRANLIMNAHDGNSKGILKDLEEEYLESLPNIGYEKEEQIDVPNFEKKTNGREFEKLKYYNEYGGFSEDGKEYLIKVNKNTKLPAVWSHILANEHFGTLLTQNMGGFTWCNNSRLNRISSWSNHTILDTPSEIIYLKDKEYNQVWSLNANLDTKDEDYYITYGFGYAKYSNIRLGLLQEVEVFVPQKEAVKVNLIRLKNTMPQKRTLKLLYYVKPVLGEDEIKTEGYVHTKYDQNSNIVEATSMYYSDIANSNCYVSSSEKIVSFTGARKAFFGTGNLKEPESIHKVRLDNQDAMGKPGCIAIELKIELKAYEDKEISIILGSEINQVKRQEIAYQYTKVDECKKELEHTKRYWSELLRTVQIKTPSESMNILLNGWIAYQTIVSRIWAKSAFYQSGGAFGFRDQLQDTLGMKFLDSNLMKNQILKHATHQFIEGDVEHWWHEETNKGIRTRFSDDLLWLAYVTAEYIDYTGEDAILQEEVPYLAGAILPEQEDEKYDLFLPSNTVGSIYEHCIKAIEKSLEFGENGLPKIGSGDWNDGFSTVGNKGKGESVWLGFFLYEVLNRFIPICESRQEQERVEKYKQIQVNLKKALNTVAWDGRWYKRAFMDDKKVLGTIENEECKIDSIAQSWAILSKAGDNDKKFIAMESLENYLVDKEHGIIKLLDPPFEKSSLEPGYIKAYLPGVRENGGQYTHAAIWTILAFAMLGLGDKANEYFKMINPIEHARTKEAVNKYKVEPYVLAADVYGIGNLIGRGGWTWYTGSSSWLYKAGIETILGLTIKKGMLSVEPCIAKEWKEYSMIYQYKSSTYYIKVRNPNGKNTGVASFKVNGEEIKEKQIKLIDNGKRYEIEVEM